MKHIKKFSLLEAQQILAPKQIRFLDRYTNGTWKLNPETGLVDIDGSFDCNNKGLKSLQGVRFGNVTGDFNCRGNQLVSLEGAPREVSGDFSCSFNQLVFLEGAPKEVGGDFNCGSNRLVSLEGAPQEVSGGFYCSGNQLVSLEGSPQKVGGVLYCDSNQLVSLEGAPQEVGGDFYCRWNPVSNASLFTIWGFMKAGNGYEISLLLAYRSITNKTDKKLLYKGIDPLAIIKKELGNKTIAPYLTILKELNIPIFQFSNDEQVLINKLSRAHHILQRK